jgi:hypothetical protein
MADSSHRCRSASRFIDSVTIDDGTDVDDDNDDDDDDDDSDADAETLMECEKDG